MKRFQYHQMDSLIKRQLKYIKCTKVITNSETRERVVAQLVERSLSIPEVRGLTPVIGKIYIEH